MLSAAEKAYFQALQALKRKEYASAAAYFEQAAVSYRQNPDFMLMWETTRLLVAVKEELAANSSQGTNEERIEIEEVFSYGQKDGLRTEV